MFLDVQSLSYIIIEVILIMCRNMKIINGRMVICIAGRYMSEIAEFPERCSLTLDAKCLGITNIGLDLTTRIFKQINDISL